MQDGVCTQLACLHVMHVRLHRHLAERARLRDATVRATIGGSDPIVLLPSNHARTARLPARRRAAFAAFLDGLVADARETTDGGTASNDASRAIAPLRPQEARAVSQACATCRGACCRTGGTTAWLTVETIRRVMTTTDRDATAVRDAYLRDLPARSYAGSCVYHTARGCALAAARRSDTCHRYLCEGAESLVTLVRRVPLSTIRVVATDEATVVRHRRLSLG
jgi:hypothetical protein